MNRTRMSAIVLGIAVLATGVFAFINPLQTANAQGGCDLSSIAGTYTFAYSGFFTDNGNSIPFSFAGRESYDGEGGVSGVSTGIDETGALGQNVPYTGRYTLDSNCYGSVFTVDENGVEVNFDIFFNEGTRTYVYNSIDLNYVYAGTSQRVSE